MFFQIETNRKECSVNERDCTINPEFHVDLTVPIDDGLELPCENMNNARARSKGFIVKVIIQRTLRRLLTHTQKMKRKGKWEYNVDETNING